MFPSPEDVPVGEGWQDTPVPAEPDEPDEAPAEPAPKRRGRPPKSEANE